jgi:hypothetical protein
MNQLLYGYEKWSGNSDTDHSTRLELGGFCGDRQKPPEWLIRKEFLRTDRGTQTFGEARDCSPTAEMQRVLRPLSSVDYRAMAAGDKTVGVTPRRGEKVYLLAAEMAEISCLALLQSVWVENRV